MKIKIKSMWKLVMLVAGAGFMGGYLWGVGRWADHFGRASTELSPVAISGGLVAALIYVAVLSAWLLSDTDNTHTERVKISSPMPAMSLVCRGEAVFSAAVVGSFCIGAAGIRTALWMVC